MLNTLITKARKGIKKYMEEKVKACTDILSSAQNRLIMGFVMAGIGVGLLASVYIRPPKN